MNLAAREHWNALYENHLRPGKRRHSKHIPAILRRTLDRCRPFDDFVLWNVLYPQYVPNGQSKTAIEIGSAPGEYLVRLRDRLNYEPYGVEYSRPGAAINRAAFVQANIDPNNVFEASLFDEHFLAANTCRFDLVVSRGFIEHFSDPTEAANAHWRLLKPGGTLLVSVPNLRRFNYYLTRLINEDVLAIHNLEIMRRQALCALFESCGAKTLFCDYYGVLNFDVTYARKGSRWRHVMAGLSVAQLALNASFRTLLPPRAGDSQTFSPHLLYIGHKPS